MTVADRPLVLCHFTAVHLTPPELVDLAAQTGFTAVAPMLYFPPAFSAGFPVLGDTPMRRETKQRLEDTGVVLFDAATCRLEPETDVRAEFGPLVETAAYLGAWTVNINGSDPDESRLADNFAALCALIGEHGLSAGLEFMMSTRVRTLGDALRLIERSGVDNARLTVDALHLSRSGGTAAEIAQLRPDQISYVQLCDGPAQVPEQGWSWENAGHRQLPGDGVLPVQALVDAVGPDVALGVEVPSAERVADGVSDAAFAEQAMRSVRRLLGRA